MAGAAIAAEGLIRHFCNVRATHYNPNAGGTNGICHAVGLGDHSGHGADADQINLLIDHIAGNCSLVHRLGVAINQHDFVFGGS